MARAHEEEEAKKYQSKPTVAKYTNKLLHDRENQDGMTVC